MLMMASSYSGGEPPKIPERFIANISRRGYSDAQISAALLHLQTAAEVTGTTLYQAGLRAYSITTWRMISALVRKYRNGLRLVMPTG